MNSTSLKQLLPQLKAQKFAGKSDDELIAYIRIYYALYNLVSVNSLDSEYGEAAIYKRKLTTLYRTLRTRFTKRTTLSEKAKILDALYCMSYSALRSNPQDFFDETASVIAAYLNERIGEKDKNSQSIADTRAGANDLKSGKAEASPVSNSTNISQSIADTSAGANIRCIADASSSANTESPADDTEYYIMRLIMMQWYGFIDEGIIPTDLKYVRTSLERWSRTQTPDGKWNGITSQQALRRIDILNLNADFTSDLTHNETIKKAYTAYLIPASPQNYELIYDLTRDVTTIGTDIPASLDAISANLPNTFSAQALQIENTCHQICREVQSTLFEE